MKITKANCVDCGVEFEYQGHRKKERCIPCAYKRAEDVARQIHFKEGPEYDKWRRRMVEVGIPRQIEGLKRWQEQLARSES